MDQQVARKIRMVSDVSRGGPIQNSDHSTRMRDNLRNPDVEEQIMLQREYTSWTQLVHSSVPKALMIALFEL